MNRGFTLLEVMVAIGILAISLTAIAGITSAGYASSEYGRGVTVATLLARSKMIDVEEQIVKDNFPAQDKEYDGDFDKEGQPDFRWEASVRMIEADIGQLIRNLMGGKTDSEDLAGDVGSLLGGLGGGGGDSGDGASPMAGMMQGEQLTQLFGQVGDLLRDSIREVTLDISWGPEDYEETISFTRYVVKGGTLNLPRTPPGRRGGAGGAGGGPRDPNAPGARNANTATPQIPGGFK